MLPTFTPLRMTGNRTEAKRTTCRGHNCGCRAISPRSSGASGTMEAVGGVGDGGGVAAVSACAGRGPANSASDGGGVDAAGVGVAAATVSVAEGVGAGGLTSARAGVEVGAGAASLGSAFRGVVGSGPVVGPGSAVGEGRETAALDSQLDSGRRRDHSQSPALNTAQKTASQEIGLWKNLRILIISRLHRSNRKRNSFCSSPPDS